MRTLALVALLLSACSQSPSDVCADVRGEAECRSHCAFGTPLFNECIHNCEARYHDYDQQLLNCEFACPRPDGGGMPDPACSSSCLAQFPPRVVPAGGCWPDAGPEDASCQCIPDAG